MFAIVEINTKQYFVKNGDTLTIERLKGKTGSIVFDKVLLSADNSDVKVGRPYLTNVKVKAEILGEKKGEKILVYKYRRRKKSRRKRGHRQIYTLLNISDIVIS